MSEDKYTLIYKKVKARLEGEKLYLDTDLTLKSLSRIVGTNTVYLSKAINQGYGASFKEVINRYRIDHLVKLFTKENESNERLEALAKQSGFRSRSTFYDVFQHLLGMTPRRYMRQFRMNTV